MKKLVFTFAAFILSAGVLFAQDSHTASHQVSITVPAVSLIDIEGPGASPNIIFSFTAPTEAGNPLVAPAPNSDLWLNLTSTAQANSQGKSIGVSLTAGTLPAGMTLKLSAANSVSGLGNKGTSGTEITLTPASQNIITGIKSGYTENGVSKGFNLTYTLELAETNAAYQALHNEIEALTVTYTMTGN